MHHFPLGLSRTLHATAALLGLLAMATTAQAQVGVLQGVVTGVQPGAVLLVFKADAKVALAEIKVEADGKFSVPLGVGVYTVKCPNETTQKVVVLNGASGTNINCK